MIESDEAICQHIEYLRLDFEDENEPEYWRMQSLCAAIQVASRANQPMPKWVSDELSKGLDKWSNLDVATLDEAFGMEPAGKRELNERANHQIACAVAGDINRAQQAGITIDWDGLASKYNKSKSTIQELYYERIKPIFDANPFR